jgi:hypothetical protein
MSYFKAPLYHEALIPTEYHQKTDKKTVYNSHNIPHVESGATLFPKKKNQ